MHILENLIPIIVEKAKLLVSIGFYINVLPK
jgi:hypothetical protein